MKLAPYLPFAVALGLLVGCGEAVPPAPELTEDVRTAIAEEDAGVQAEESQR